MAYSSTTVAVVMKRLNFQYFLPAIQREFVWSADQIISLFDSIMRRYPISSFLFWELKDENREKWEAYKFIENASYGGARNELANIDGVHQLTLILDGQQRLTSLLVGLKGTYTTKKKYKRWDDPSAWIKQRLYLDLLKDPMEEVEDGEAGIHYGFQFREDGLPSDDSHCWFRLGKILDFDSEDRFYDFRQEERERLPGTTTKQQMAVFERNLDRLYNAVWREDVIAYYTEDDQDYDRVLDIFVRANEGGTKLSKSDLLLSMITSKWSGINARDEIYGFVDRLNEDLTGKNDLDKDFIMKSCLVLSDLPVAYKVRNFNNQNLSLIQSKWEGIKSAIERTVELTNSFGIDRGTLTSVNALVPIAYYLYGRPLITLRRETVFDVQTAAAVRRWLCMALLNGVFGGSSDAILANIRGVLREHAGADRFPIDEINRETARSGRVSYFNDQAIEDFLETTYRERAAFLALSILYDDSRWGTTPFQQDHIFPQAMFSWKHMSENGFSRESWIWYNTHKDYIVNLELLLAHENQEKSSMPFDEWIKTRDASFRKRHLIPDDPELWRFEHFERFLDAREGLIAGRLMQLLGPPESSDKE